MAHESKFKVSVAMTYSEWMAILRVIRQAAKPSDYTMGEWTMTMGEANRSAELIISKVASDERVKKMLAKRKEREQSSPS